MGLTKDKNDLVLLGVPELIDTGINGEYISTPNCDCHDRFQDFFTGANYNRLELHIYDETGTVKIKSTDSDNWSYQNPDPNLINDSYKVKIDIDEDLKDNKITQGAFHCEYYFLRPITNFVIEQISPSRKEIRVKPLNTSTNANGGWEWDVEGYYGLLSYNSISSNGNKNELLANFGDSQYETVVNWTTNGMASGIPKPTCKQIDDYNGSAAGGSTNHSAFDQEALPIDYDSHPSNDPNDLWETIVLKLYKPLPDNIVVTTIFELDLSIFQPFIRDVILLPQEKKEKGRHLRAPDWDIRTKDNIQQGTGCESRDSLLGTVEDVKMQLINKFLSGSEGVDLNYDFKYFNDFIHFSSAKDRLDNFYYKVQKIEEYNQSIVALSTGIPTAFASLSASQEYQNNIIKFKDKKESLIGTFDQYENYLYYESSSHGSSSFDKAWWYSTSWPKSGSVKPYPLYSYSSSAVSDWWGSTNSKTGAIYSASLYDIGNQNELVKTIPSHIRESGFNDFYELFVKMCGQHFDTLYFHTKHLATLIDRNESLDIGIPKTLIYNVLQGFGWNPNNGMQFDDLWKAALGTNVSGSFHVTSSFSVSQSMDYVVSESTPREEISQEVWKRILNNLPYLLKAKGSWEAVRALINCYGIPSTMLDIKEYGGPNKLDAPSYFTHDKFDYSLNFNAFSGSYLEIGAEPETDDDLVLSTTARTQDAIEFRFKTVNANLPNEKFCISENPGAALATSESMQVLVASGSSDKNAIRIRQSGSTAEWGVIEQVMESGSTGLYVTQSIGPIPIFNGGWWTVLYQRLSGSNSDDIDQTYQMYIKQQSFGKITQNFSGSWIVSGSVGNISSSYQTNNILRNTRTTTFGSGGFHGYPFTGSMQEIRLWGTALTESKFDKHVLSPLTYVGNNSTASYDDLYARYMLGTDVKKWDRTQYRFISSSQPNQFITTFSAGAPLRAKAYLFLSGSNGSYHPNEEVVYQVWPDTAGNRSISNKIRIESSKVVGNLSLQTRAEMAAYDQYPNDSSKIGVYFSPTNEINEDIAEQMGGFNIDDIIGDPRLQFSQSYEELRILRDDYFKKYASQGLVTGFDDITNDNKYSYVEYLRLVKFFDTSLFKQIEYLLPARSNPLLGVVIEPHVLERNKQSILTSNPSFSIHRTEAELVALAEFQASIPDSKTQQGSTLWTIATAEAEIYPSSSFTGSINDYSSSISTSVEISSSYILPNSASIDWKDWEVGSGTYFDKFKEITASGYAYTGSHPNLYGLAKTSSFPPDPTGIGITTQLPPYYLPNSLLNVIEITVTGSRLSIEYYEKKGFMTESINSNFTIPECDLSGALGKWQSSSYELAQYQDYMTLGQYRSLYAGSKVSSPDWNKAAQNANEGTVNLNGVQDTPDGKAVVEIFYTNPDRIFYSPAHYGNMRIGAPQTSTGFTFLGNDEQKNQAINYNMSKGQSTKIIRSKKDGGNEY